MAQTDQTGACWPPEFDVSLYRRLNRDLRWMSERRLTDHYRRRGGLEGRVCCEIASRAAVLERIDPGARILEIGPFDSPVFERGRHDVAYVDILTTDELRARAAEIPDRSPGTVPEIDYVWSGGLLSDLIPERFDVVFSSHNIEHQPCLITHLQELASLLRPGGQVVLFVPDRRYCFDHFLPETTLLDILAAWVEPRGRRHQVRDVVKHWLFVAHNDAGRHWRGGHGDDPHRAMTTPAGGDHAQALKDFHAQAPAYLDVHAWQFTPDSFRGLVAQLNAMRLSPLTAARVYPTVTGSQEFYAVLTAPC